MNRFQLRDFRFRDIGPVNLTVKPGECAGISGPSGAGKSQFLRAIADLDPHTGEMFLDEAVSDSVPAHEWRRQVGLLPAESAWWGDIVSEHFSEVDEKQLVALGFSPQVMEWEVSRLSSGERQRMSLLRLFANRPAVLLLDEPTANLDPDSVARVEELVQAYRKEYRPAIFWVSHDPRQLGRVADRRFVIADRSFREV